MYIYLDESYNLKDRKKKQFISINGFAVLDERSLFKIQPSTTDILLEFADFISNIFYRAYIKDDEKFFENLKFKMVQIKNPLK